VIILSLYAAAAALWDIQQIIRDSVIRNEQNHYSDETAKHRVQLHITEMALLLQHSKFQLLPPFSDHNHLCLPYTGPPHISAGSTFPLIFRKAPAPESSTATYNYGHNLATGTLTHYIHQANAAATKQAEPKFPTPALLQQQILEKNRLRRLWLRS
jgi:hypothetical protein